jgi:hypothetical protein
MTPRDVDELSTAEYTAMVKYANREIRAQERASRQAAKRR